jgi:hypothetical protein
LARDIEKHVEGSTQVGCLEIDARDSLWKYGFYAVGRLTRK